MKNVSHWGPVLRDGVPIENEFGVFRA